MEVDVHLPGDPETEDETTEQARYASSHDLFNFTTRTHSITLITALSFSIVSGIIIPALAFLVGKIFNLFTEFGGGEISGPDLKRDVGNYGLALFGLGCLSGLLNASYFMLWMIFGELQAKSAREKLFEGMIKKDVEWYDKRAAGVNLRLQTYIRELQTGTSQALGEVLQYLITVLTALGLAFYYSWRLTLVTVATVPVLFVIYAKTSVRMERMANMQAESLTLASKLANSAISAVDTVKSFNGQTVEKWQYANAIKQAATHCLSQVQASAVQMGFTRLITLGIFVQGFWYGSYLVYTGQKNAGAVLTCFWACLIAMQTAGELPIKIVYLDKGKIAGAKLKAAIVQMERGRRVTSMVGRIYPLKCIGDIKFSNVSYSYYSQRTHLALKNATLDFRAGETTFVVGESGSGKSTISNLLIGFYSPRHGNILIDGHSIRTLDHSWIRNNITLVQQHAVLFNETVFRNIALGRKDHKTVSRKEVQCAIETALLQHIIKDLPKGWDTMAGTKGNNLSGGQIQRVAIARARLRDTPILILDEATSALDHSTKMLVVDAIRKWRCGKTTIIITHDMSQVQQNDFVYVLERGEVIHGDFRYALEKTKQGPFGRNMSIVDFPHMVQQPPPSMFFRQSDPSNTRTVSSQSNESDDSMLIDIQPRRKAILSVLGKLADDLPPQFLARMPVSMPPPVAFPVQHKPQASYPMPYDALSMDCHSPKTLASIHQIWVPNLKELGPKQVEPVHDDIMMAVLHQEKKSQLKRPALMSRASKNLATSNLLSGGQQKRKRFETSGRIMSLKRILMTIWPRLTWKTRLILVLGFIFAAIHAAATPVFAYVFAKLLGTFYLADHNQRSQQARTWSLSVLGVAVMDGAASYFMRYLLEYCGQAWIDSLRMEALKRILDQPRSWFDKEENNISHLTGLLDRNAEETRNLLGRFAAIVSVAAIMSFMAVTWSIILSWKLTLVGLACGPYAYIIIRSFEVVSGRWEGKTDKAGKVTTEIFDETFSNIRTVRALTLESFFHLKYFNSVQDAFRIGLRRSAYSGFFFGLQDSATPFVSALIFYYGAVLASSNTYTVQSLFTAIAMLLFSIGNLNDIAGDIPQINSSRSTASDLIRLTRLPYKSSHEYTGQLRLAVLGPITFANATFAYQSHPSFPVLRSLNLTLPPSTSIALVGASGCGKSTIASLLLGLYPLLSGTISFNGIPISNLHLPSLRSLIAIVTQQPTLFPTTITKNIVYGLPEGSPNASLPSIRAAAKAAGIDTWISSLPDGYETLIGDGASGLSGGQAQRIAVARAVVRKPKLLVLDEATSALDAGNVRGIGNMIREMVRREMGVLVITHDSRMMRVCREVVVLKEGRVCEKGGFDELVRSGGELARLVGSAV